MFFQLINKKTTTPKHPLPLYSIQYMKYCCSCSRQNFITMHCTSNSQMPTYLFHQIDAQYQPIKNWHILLAPKVFNILPRSTKQQCRKTDIDIIACNENTIKSDSAVSNVNSQKNPFGHQRTSSNKVWWGLEIWFFRH